MNVNGKLAAVMNIFVGGLSVLSKEDYTMKKKCRIIFLCLVLLINGVAGVCMMPSDAQAKTQRLRVKGNHIVDASGKTKVLKGVSTHGIAWYPQYINKKAFKTLRDRWGVNTIRLAMYTEEYGGYCSGGDKKALKNKIERGVKYASELGMYAIIDWHILNDNDPTRHQKAAKKFFASMAKKYKNHNNVIYEICNEPHGVSWHSRIKPYAKKITAAIRKYDKHAIIVVGTGTWSQDVDEVIGDRLSDRNTMYALHFYAATHKDWNRQKAKKALDAGIPVFVTEFSICEASGTGKIDKASAKKWIKLLKKYHVSHVAWNLSNKNEKSALIKPSCKKYSGWKNSDLTASGKWYLRYA